MKSLTCDDGEVVKWDGGAWACGDDVDTTDSNSDTVDPNTDTLADLSCASGQVAKWNGGAWACADDEELRVQPTEVLVP